MTINVFEGARRIMLLFAALWGIGVVVYVWNDEPTVYMSYTVEWPDQPPERVAQNECTPEDAQDWQHVSTTNGMRVNLTFCFKAHKTDKGQMLIPYRVDWKDKQWWGGERYSSEVSRYKNQTSSEFRLSKADSEWADSQWWPARWKQIRDGALWLFGGWLVLWIFASVTGWIVRGFMGIPMGRDAKPTDKPEA